MQVVVNVMKRKDELKREEQLSSDIPPRYLQVVGIRNMQKKK